MSSPVQTASRRRARQTSKAAPTLELHKFHYSRDDDDDFVVGDDEDEGAVSEAEDDSEVDFEPVRVKGKAQSVSKRPLGPPITTDEKIERLNNIHQMVVEGFLSTAKDEGRKVGLAGVYGFTGQSADNRKILISKGLMHAPFTDTILREMAINFPQSMCPHAGDYLS